MADQAETAAPARRVILLGASNVARGFSTIVATARELWDEPLDIVAALGHGRSFGQSNNVLGRTLPGILPCGLWQALEQRPRLPAVAVVTDIGNDLLYGVPAARVLQWVGEVTARLETTCQRVVVTQLPLASIRQMRREQFRVMRSIFFPRSRLEYEQALQAAEELGAGLRHLVEQRGGRLLEPAAEWYGWDPIHIRRTCFAQAWPSVLANCLTPPACAVPPAPRVAWPMWWRLHTLRPEQRRVFGMRQGRPQPAHCFADGTRISLY